MFNNFTNHIIKSLETNRPPYGLTLIPKQNKSICKNFREGSIKNVDIRNKLSSL